VNTYFALVHKDADSAYGISFPDLPGCFSAADDEDEIFPQAQSALTLFASDEQALPVSRPVSKLRADPEVRAEIAAGAFLIAVPLIIVNRKLRYNLMLASDLVEGVDATAKAMGVSRSEFVSEAIGERLKTQVGAVLMRESKTGRHSGVSHGSSEKDASSAAKVLNRKAAKSAAASALTQKVKKK
jgi:predicted RNase H-like HicB family nuclease